VADRQGAAVTNLATAWRPFEPCLESMPPSTPFDCACCGLENDVPGAEFSDSDYFTCTDCGARSFFTVDIEYDDDGEDISEVYVGHYECKHSKHEEDACDLCEIEFGGGVGEVG
jgi:DNA-directed RNA polymerase subunit RPC12/RpoP